MKRTLTLVSAAFLAALPAALAIAAKTTEKYITAWCKSGQLVRVSQGKYRKNS